MRDRIRIKAYPVHFEWMHDNWGVRLTGELGPYAPRHLVQNRIPYWYAPIQDEATGRWISSHVDNQDYIAWVGEGQITDRTQEHLMLSDRSVVMLRRGLLADIEASGHGKDPKSIVRDPARHKNVRLPMVGRDSYINGLRIVALKRFDGHNPVTPESFAFAAGQPEDIKRAYEEAMGFATKEFPSANSTISARHWLPVSKQKLDNGAVDGRKRCWYRQETSLP